jgi:hypothetical protein
MAVDHLRTGSRASSRAGRLRRTVHVLFPEARRLGRRRRLRYAGLALLFVAAVLALVALGRGSAGRNTAAPGARPASVAVASLTLPRSGNFSSITVAGRRLIVSGTRDGYALISPGYSTSLVGGRAAGVCDAAAVDPRTLVLGPVVRANCGDPALYGERVLPIAYALVHQAYGGSFATDVRIARFDPAARDQYQLGSVITRYRECSDCQMSWIYGDGSLWIYNPLASLTRSRSGELFRISTRTGRVLQRWKMPEIVRALLAVDSNGLWLAPSIESGVPGRLSPARAAPYVSLYRIVPGPRSPRRILTVGGSGARWLVASGHTASVAVDDRYGYSTVWTFTGTTPPVHGKPLSNEVVGAEMGYGEPSVAGNDTIGFYDVELGNGLERVLRIDATGRQAQTIAKIPAPDATMDDGPPVAVALGGSFFFLDPPTYTSAGSLTGTIRLHRVTP